MKKILLIVLFLCFLSVPVNAQNTLALQEKCAEGAKKFFTESLRNEVGQQSFNGHHYNKKLDRCFVEIGYSYGKEKVKVGDREDSFFTCPSWEVRLYDVFGNSTLTVFPSPFARYYRAKCETVDCYVESRKCKSIDEYDSLIRPYMKE